MTASIQAKAVCITCLGTYALVICFAIGALKLIGDSFLPKANDLMPGVGWVLVLSVPIYIGLLYPGSKTPVTSVVVVPKLDQNDPKDFEAIVAGLPEQERLSASWARAHWKAARQQDVSMFPVHALRGDPNAPVKLVEFTDILCGHCAQFEMMFRQIEEVAPLKSLALEPRYFPLDKECNPGMPASAGDGVRCYGARLQICTEKLPRFFEMRSELFANQARLDQGMMLSIAKRYGVDEAELNACMKAAQTDARIAEDIAYARKYAIEGTPLVLLNGKVVPPSPIFLMAMALSGGNADSPLLLTLPPPPKE